MSSCEVVSILATVAKRLIPPLNLILLYSSFFVGCIPMQLFRLLFVLCFFLVIP